MLFCNITPLDDHTAGMRDDPGDWGDRNHLYMRGCLHEKTHTAA